MAKVKFIICQKFIFLFDFGPQDCCNDIINLTGPNWIKLDHCLNIMLIFEGEMDIRADSGRCNEI